MSKKYILTADDVVDDLTSLDTSVPLSANQGRVLNTNKQDTLVSGTNIKSVNNVSVLGSGNASSEDLGIVVNLTKSQYDALTSEEKLSGKIFCTTDEGTTADYNDLTNKPSINSVTLSGNKTSSDLGVQNVPTVVSQSAPSAITIADNTEYILTDVSTLTFTYPASGSYSAYIRMTTASSGTITVTFPTSMYVPKVPTFGNGETWLLGIDNGIVIAQKAVAS